MRRFLMLVMLLSLVVLFIAPSRSDAMWWLANADMEAGGCFFPNPPDPAAMEADGTPIDYLAGLRPVGALGSADNKLVYPIADSAAPATTEVRIESQCGFCATGTPNGVQTELCSTLTHFVLRGDFEVCWDGSIDDLRYKPVPATATDNVLGITQGDGSETVKTFDVAASALTPCHCIDELQDGATADSPPLGFVAHLQNFSLICASDVMALPMMSFACADAPDRSCPDADELVLCGGTPGGDDDDSAADDDDSAGR